MSESVESVAPRRRGVRRFLGLGAALALVGTASFAVAAGASGTTPHALGAGSDIYMSIPGVNGDGSSAGGANTIEVSSYSFGATNQVSTSAGARGARGKVKISSVVVTKSIDRASPLFFQNACQGAHYPTVILYVRKAGTAGTPPGDALQITLTNVFVSAYSMGDGSNENPTESITLNFTKIQMDYTPQGAAAIHAGWDLKSGTKV